MGNTTTYYLYNLNDQLIAEISGAGTVLREYVWLDGEPFLLAEYTGASAGMYFYLNDHLGTPQQLLNGETGAVAWQAAYLPFGEAQVQVSAVTNNLRFPGQYYDAETELHYNWNRYYNPDSGRYISTDPIGLEGGTNLYMYTVNPINRYDEQGLVDYDYDGFGFHVRLDTKDKITFRVVFHEDGTYELLKKGNHPFGEREMKIDKQRFDELIRIPEEQKKMRKVFVEAFDGQYKDKVSIRTQGKYLRYTIRTVKASLIGIILGDLMFPKELNADEEGKCY